MSQEYSLMTFKTKKLVNYLPEKVKETPSASTLSQIASTLISFPSNIYKSIQPLVFIPSLLAYSVHSVVRLHLTGAFPKSWDLRTSISVAVLKSGMEYRGNSSSRIKLLQSLAVTPIPSNITVTTKTISYLPSTLYNVEQLSKKSRCPSLPDIPRESKLNSEIVDVVLEFITVTKNLEGKRNYILYSHGGAYFCGSLQTHRALAYILAEQTSATIVMVSYRLSPEFTFPCALHDVFAAYMYITQPEHDMFIVPRSSDEIAVEKFRVSDNGVILMGDSAGGGLSLGLILYIKDYINTGGLNYVTMPISGVLLSPWVDLSCSSASWSPAINQDYLPSTPPLGYFFNLFDSEKGNPVLWYTAGNEENITGCVGEGDCDSGVGLIDSKIDEEDAIKLVSHPLVSPYNANLFGIPPLLIQAGGVELIKDETIEITKRLQDANPGNESLYRHELYKDMPHVFQTFFWTESSKIAMSRAGEWCKKIWNKELPCSIRFEDNSLVESIYAVDLETSKEVMVEEESIIPLEEFFSIELASHPFF